MLRDRITDYAMTYSIYLENQYTELDTQRALFKFSFLGCIEIRWSSYQWFYSALNYFEIV